WLDNLDPLFLKLSAAIVATPITSLFNLSFVSSEIPKEWKAAAVIPLFKGGDTLEPKCYRPISILPCLSKVFESQVNKQITDHLESHHTFSSVQSGFRAGHGCTSATLKTTPFCIPPSLDTVLSNLQTSFNAIQHSFRGLQLLLNASKTKCMLFNRSLPAPACPTSITTLDGSDLEYVDIYKYLGVWLDCKLSFQTHIKHLQSKIKSRVGFLFRNKASFTHPAKLTLVKLTILPILDFGDVIYKIASKTILSMLDAVYHSAIRFVTKAPYITHHCDLYALVGWPSLHPLAPGHLQVHAR
ncbi:unnamed protein product, partial [Oncorhynchus mykiss]